MKFILSLLLAVPMIGAEIVSDPTFTSFPTPASGTAYTTGATNQYGPWHVNSDALFTGALLCHPHTQGTNVAYHPRWIHETNALKVAAWNYGTISGYTNGLLVDVWNTVLSQEISNLVAGATYQLVIGHDAVGGNNGQGQEHGVLARIYDPATKVEWWPFGRRFISLPRIGGWAAPSFPNGVPVPVSFSTNRFEALGTNAVLQLFSYKYHPADTNSASGATFIRSVSITEAP